MPVLSTELVALLYGLAATASWGVSDFNGGLATKKSPVYSVVLISELLGGVLLLVLALALAEPVPPLKYWLLGAGAGLAGGVGLAALYSSLAHGRMGIVAPVAAVVAAGLPVAVGLFREGKPTDLQLVGLVLALLAVWLISRGSRGEPIRLKDLGLPVLAGVAFGFFFILVDQVSDTSILWPLISARCASIPLLVILALVSRQRMLPGKGQFFRIALVGVLDTAGNGFYALAVRAGRLDISTAVSSLYPGITVLLAWLVLKEKLSWRQWLGVAMALAALALIAV